MGVACARGADGAPRKPPPRHATGQEDVFRAEGAPSVDPGRVTPVLSRPADFVTWTNGSKIKRAVLKYNDRLDDYDLLGE